MTIYDPTITNSVNPNLQFIVYKQVVIPWTDFEYEDNTSSKTLSYESGTIDIESELEPNTSLIGYNEIRPSLEPIMERFATWTETIKPTMEALNFIAERIAERMKPIIKGLELISIYRKDIDVLRYENIVEPFDFHIKTNIKDDLIIDSVEDTKALLDDLKNVKVDKELSKYFTKRLNE